MAEGLTLDEYQQAEIHVQGRIGRRGFALHAILYVLANVAFVLINVLGNSDVIWFPYVMVGWGIGVLIHYLSVARWSPNDVRRHQKSVEKHALRGDV